jgi:imidazolonepropionase-like amidohydrolase
MRHLNKIFALFISILFFGVTFAQTDQINRTIGTGKFALTNAKIFTVTNGTIENGTIIINNGIIEAVGSNISIPSDAILIDYQGQEIYPGMIDSGTQLGLVEIGSVEESRDYQEFGAIKPQMEALTAVNPNSEAIPVTRVSGVTTVITAPSGGVLPGIAASINLFGYTPDQMYAGAKGLIINFPNSGRRWRQTPEQAEKAKEIALKTLNETWDKAEIYSKISGSEESKYYPEMAAISRVIDGELKVYIEVNAAKDILSAIEWIKERKLSNVVFTGVSEGWRVANEIAEANIPVITGPVLAVPSRRSDAYDVAYKNPGIIQQAGVKVALRTNDTENSRNIPYNAGFAATYGMGREEALKAITINAAEIIGIDDTIGSIEVGKKANLFVATGDPFETSTQIVDVFINGYQVPMTSRQIELYNEFLNRIPGLNVQSVTTDE